jgi:hypothetical protein
LKFHGHPRKSSPFLPPLTSRAIISYWLAQTPIPCSLYSRITSTKSPVTFHHKLQSEFTKPTALLPQSRNCSCYVSGPILAPPPLWLQKHSDLRAHDLAHFLDLLHQPMLANFSCAWSWRLSGNNAALSPFQAGQFFCTEQRHNKFFRNRCICKPHSIKPQVTKI